MDVDADASALSQQLQQQEQQEGAERQPGAGSALSSGRGSEDDAGNENDWGEEDEEASGEPAVVLTKAQQQLLLVPVGALKFPQPLGGPLSCVAFSPEAGLVVAGTAGESRAAHPALQSSLPLFH